MAPWSTLLTIFACVLTTTATTVLVCTSTARLSLSDAFLVGFIIGPHLLLALLSWIGRGSAGIRWLFALLAGISLIVGLALFGHDSYRYHTEPHYRKITRLHLFVIPLVQWLLLTSVALIVFSGQPRRDEADSD